MDYKSTLNLPKTSFPMKGNLPRSEPKILEQWEREGLYSRFLEHRKGAPAFILHDGPPYANGDIHIGHALNKVLKDFIVRYKGMRGKKAPYIPGWDCHGLPIEYALMKELKVTKHQVDTVEFRRKARAYAMKYVGIQRDQFKRLAVLGDWEHPYLTLEPGYVSAALRVLSTLVQKNFVYRARKPVNWCWSCETALAEAEVEYEMHRSPSIYVKFELTPESLEKLRAHFKTSSSPSMTLEGKLQRGSDSRWSLPSTPIEGGNDRMVLKESPNQSRVWPERISFMIWTTTPWTIMGNVAVAVHPSAEYSLIRRSTAEGEEGVIVSSKLAGFLSKGVEESNPENVIATFRGEQLEDLTYRHPFLRRIGKVVLADYVTLEDGTGLVHTAPGFGAEDYTTGKKYGLEVLAPVDSRGQFVGLPKEVAQFNGQQVQAANPGVIELLKQQGTLVKAGDEEHQYPHCWRCHNPIIFRATDQWFLNVEHENLRRKLLEVVEGQVQWIPPEGKERMAGMIKTRPDWCLSRQRLWGIPIPAVICSGCGEGILDHRVIDRFAKEIENEPEGSDRWFTEPVGRWLPERFKCRCGKSDFKPGTDILDVWFDSGVSHQAVLKRREDHAVPADMYLEGSDQHRGWFQVSLITGVALEGKAPYRGVLTHGFVVDGQGRKMSKSLGNVIAPQEVVSSLGADVLRLWVAASDYGEDVRISPEILSQVAEVYRKIRNTLRFMLANLSDFPASEIRVPQEKMGELSRWLLLQMAALTKEVTDAYDQYAFHRAVKKIHEFCTGILSNFYLDVIKDRLYTSYPSDPQRREIQTVLAILTDTMIRLIAPILPLTAEEAWAVFRCSVPGTVSVPGTGLGSVHLQDWPSSPVLPPDASLEADWARLIQFRDQAMKALEKAREGGQIGDSLEAELEILVQDKESLDFLTKHRSELELACIVSKLEIVPGSGPALQMNVRPAAGSKCQRCWMRLPSVGASSEHPALCHRCVETVNMWYTLGLR